MEWSTDPSCPTVPKVGDVLKVEMEQMLDGVEILSVVKGRREERAAPTCSRSCRRSEPFQEVIETRAQRGRDSRGKSAATVTARAVTATTARAGDRPPRDRKRRRARRDDDGAEWRGRPGRSRERRRAAIGPISRRRPRLPQRPKPKRLRPGKARRNAVLADIPEEQRPIAELASQGMAAVRTRVKEENAKLEAEGKPTMPEASVVKMAEELLPKLRVAEWLDRAEAAQRQMDHLDLRDLRSVIIAGDDSIVARDETARGAEHRTEGVARSPSGGGTAAVDRATSTPSLGVGRVIRALRLSSQPPKAGVMFPPELARRLGEAATQALQPDDTADRWIAVLEAAAFSPVRSLVNPTAPPDDDHRRPASHRAAPRPGAPADRRPARRRGSRRRAPAQAAAADRPPGRQAQAGRRSPTGKPRRQARGRGPAIAPAAGQAGDAACRRGARRRRRSLPSTTGCTERRVEPPVEPRHPPTAGDHARLPSTRQPHCRGTGRSEPAAAGPRPSTDRAAAESTSRAETPTGRRRRTSRRTDRRGRTPPADRRRRLIRFAGR